MPARKYAHVRKKSASAVPKPLGGATGASSNKSSPGRSGQPKRNDHKNHRRADVADPDPQRDKALSQVITAVSNLENAIAKILLIRYEQDIARLYSTRLYSIALVHLPTLMLRCSMILGPGWVANNAGCDEIKDFFRANIGMDLREAGERVATKSVLWSYTAIRDFALSNNVSVCRTKGLRSVRLLPYYPALQSHCDFLESMPPPTFSKPSQLGSLTEGYTALESACNLKYQSSRQGGPNCEWTDTDWRSKIRLGYDLLSKTLWSVAQEYDVRGYGNILRDKLTTNWCDCGCSTEHLGEVCEASACEYESGGAKGSGKRREWDGRGNSVAGWDTVQEEDVWEANLDFAALAPDDDEKAGGFEDNMTISNLLQWRYLKAEHEKELGNTAFKKGNFASAVKFYEKARAIEPELPYYQLNIAAAHLKLNNWMEAEKACTQALVMHNSVKGYYRRAKARRMLGRERDAIEDFRSVLSLQPNNVEALAELESLQPRRSRPEPTTSSSSTSLISSSPSSSSKEPRSSGSYLHETRSSRMSAGDQKLRIVVLPVEVEIPKCMFSVDAGSASLFPESKEGKIEMTVQTFPYPSWDRYAVQKGST